MSQPETIVPDLPPRRPLPPDVRERMRRRVVGGGAVRTPLAAAAAVAVLAAGGAIVAQSTQGDDTIAVAPPTTTSSTAAPSPRDVSVIAVAPRATEDDAARCGFAVTEVRFTIGLPGRRILAAANDRFCEITHTEVSRNKPEAGTFPLAGGAASLLWRAGTGVLIGRMPAGTSDVKLTVALPSGGPVVSMPVSVVEDLFLIPQSAVRMSVVFTTASGPLSGEIDIEALPRPDVWSQSRQEWPPGDRVVARCLDLTMRDGVDWVGDPLKWRPGAFSGAGVDAWLAIHDQAGVTAYCHVYHGEAATARPGDTSPQDGALVKVRWSDGRGIDPTSAQVALGGTVDTAKVGGLEIVDAQGQTVPAVLVEGTFVARLDDQPPLDARRGLTKGFQIRVLDHGNQVVETVTLE
ncbi:hypothetical protein ALI22I_12990 [Saccharothrix sp. ALI-22-I]|uniref:hypothetical protein n=1 Tax=Saccharothrix sp. ALI-22-I TaxID=1933778 RepID=UPI00097BF086|nr:hypothetical protein [Saccharothrix sp. ALI-22-I]ONI90233.1 hypothetical protein ALI22I_12990 [Saccharothrix sp. ALI-22-I]